MKKKLRRNPRNYAEAMKQIQELRRTLESTERYVRQMEFTFEVKIPSYKNETIGIMRGFQPEKFPQLVRDAVPLELTIRRTNGEVFKFHQIKCVQTPKGEMEYETRIMHDGSVQNVPMKYVTPRAISEFDRRDVRCYTQEGE